MAGTGKGFSGDGGLAAQATPNTPWDVAASPDGSVLVADTNNHRIRKVSPLFPGLSLGDIVVPSEDGSEVYVFSGAGKHLRTQNAMTGAVLYTFAYDARGVPWTSPGFVDTRQAVIGAACSKSCGLLWPRRGRTVGRAGPGGDGGRGERKKVSL